MLDRIEFLLGEALVSFRRNSLMTFAAISTSAMALFLIGALGYAYIRIGEVADAQADAFTIRVFLLNELEQPQIETLQGEIQAIEGVVGVTFIGKEEALEAMQRDMPSIDLEGITEVNPLPNSFQVEISDTGKAAGIAEKIRALEGPDPSEKDGGVVYDTEVQQLLSQLMGIIRWFGLTVGGLLTLTAGVLIYNAIRLTVVARRREIRIMHLVGATPATVWTPMLIEGVLQGVFGGLLATLVLATGYSLLRGYLAQFSAFGDPGAMPATQIASILVGMGAFYGLICSLVAVREPRKDR